MKVILSILLFILTVPTADLLAQTPDSLREARILAAEKGKPILMEFLRPG